jgi:hypothetical protein
LWRYDTASREGSDVRRLRADNPILAPPPARLELRNGHGAPYCRLPAVESQLGELLGLPTHAALQGRVTQPDRAADGYVREESVAYFLREWQRAGASGARDWLVGQALDRVDGFINAHLYGLNGLDREHAHQEVVATIFRQMLDLTVPRGEYFQVRFWHALARRCNDKYEHYHRLEEREKAYRADDPRDRGEGGDVDPASAIPDADARVEDRVIDREALRRVLQSVRDRVTPDQLEAYALRMNGWPIEGTKGPTLSERYGKTPKTINNWIRAVDAALAAAREEYT